MAQEEDIVRKGSSVISATPTNEVMFEALDMPLFNYLLLRTYQLIEPGKSTVHYIPVKDVMEYLRIDRMSKLQDSLERLGKGLIAIDYLDEDDEPRSIYAHYLSSDLSRTGSGMLAFAFDAILTRFISEPKVYGLISVNRIRDLPTFSAQKLYEIMALNFRKKSPVWRTTPDELRCLWQMGKRNARWDNFRTHVIEKAVADVNAVADFDVRVEYVRGGRGGGVVEIVFTAVTKDHNRLIEAASVKAITARRAKVDPHTVDMLDGMTYAERGGPAALTPAAVEEVRAMMDEDGDINRLVDEWRDLVRGHALVNPDHHFVSWAAIRLRQDKDPLLGDLEGDVFGNLLGGRD
mgnify:CR=1 FL=1